MSARSPLTASLPVRPESDAADVAILIVSYNTKRHIESCLRSVFERRAAVRQQVIVVDNASADDSIAMIRETFPEVDVVGSSENLGFARAVNLAARRANAEFLLLLNPDTVILDNAVDTIVEFARSNPGLGLYGGRAVRFDGSLEPSSCWALPTLWSLAMFATGLSTLAKGNRWLDPESMGNWQRDTVREVGMVTGCFLLVPSSVWRELGGFDARYFMYGEDADLATRARVAGYRPTICPDAVIVHEVGKASATKGAKLLLSCTGSATLLRTHWRGPRRAVGLRLFVAGVGLRAMAARLAGVLRKGNRGNAWPEVWKERRRWIAGYPPTAKRQQSTGEVGGA